MANLRDTYGNSGPTGYTMNFFSVSAAGAKDAWLASPFFSTYEPVRYLTDRGCRVKLLVRLCSITPPPIIRQALSDPNVTLRYFTDRSFHAKLYIVDDVALIGSANLTNAGLMTNREVSVVLQRGRDAGFDDLPAMFNQYWEYASVMTSEVCSRYEQAFRLIGKPIEEQAFEAHLENLVGAASPPNAKVGSELVSARRSFIQSLRQKYDEELIPAFREVERVFVETGQRRPEFADGDPEIELGRFLGWLRIARAPADDWKSTALADELERKKRTLHYLGEWRAVADTTAGDMFNAEREVANINRLRAAFSSVATIEALTYDELFDALISVHAFYDRLRFVAGGLPGLRAEFGAKNTLSAIKKTLTYLLHGPGTALERAYDCIYNESHRLAGFGEAGVMEFLGWMDTDRPPINGRTVKALRFLGFDVKE